jgi:hypothetical protein
MTVDPRRIQVWVSMADHFLDTETRQDIPLTALACVQAGMTPAEAADVWRYEVSPAVGFNSWSVAGEWQGWDRDWLVRRIEWCRPFNRPGTLRWLRYRIRVHLGHGDWVAISRCIDALRAIPSADDRARFARDLSVLGRVYFDLDTRELAAQDGPARDRIHALYPEPFTRLLAPCVLRGEARPADERVRAALSLMSAPARL